MTAALATDPPSSFSRVFIAATLPEACPRRKAAKR